jgi:phage-related protein
MSTQWTIELFQDHRGGQPVKDFLYDGQLLPSEINRLLSRLEFARNEKLLVSSHIVSQIELGIFELRAENSVNNPRILFTTIGTRIILLHGFAKVGRSSNKIPPSELQVARQRRAIFLEREETEKE